MIREVTIGVVYHDETLTLCERINADLARIEQHSNVNVDAAVALLLDTKLRNWRDTPIANIAGEDNARLIDALIEFYRTTLEGPPKPPTDVHFTWHTAAGTGFANRGSQVLHEFTQRVRRDDLLLPPDSLLVAELQAFEHGYPNGTLTYTAPENVGTALGRYPARALAVMLAAMPAPHRHVVKSALPMDYSPVDAAARVLKW